MALSESELLDSIERLMKCRPPMQEIRQRYSRARRDLETISLGYQRSQY